MKNILLVLLLAASPFILAAVPGPPADHAGFKDPALFTRLPNFYLSYNDSVLEKQFDFYDFPVTKANKPGKEHVEGHYWYYKYRFNESAGPIPSNLQIIRNYQAAALRIGGKVMMDNPASTTLLIARDKKESWVYVQPFYGGKEYHLIIVERETMQQDVVANAQAFQDGLAQNGHVEVPGIFFDFNKADVKPESEPALREVAKLLQGSPALRVWVVGHTDSVGTAEVNVSLANARAAAVVRYLTQQLGVDPRRLTPYGVGPYAPVASNATEEGRAKNRRVELVAQP